MTTYCKIMFATLCLAIFAVPSAFAEKRVALVIGNSKYQSVAELANPLNDATAMAGKLTEIGFEVVEGIDLDLVGMRQTIRKFVNRLTGADIALFYYAGHGLQVSGQNFLVPIDATLKSEDDLDFEAVPIRLILAAMERNAKASIVFLDACRDNPLARNLARSMGTRSTAVGRGLASVGAGVGTFVSFSTEPGNVALDGTGKHSPYTQSLLQHIGKPGANLASTMVRVRNDVIKSTNGKQVPWEHSSLTGDVILNQNVIETTQPVSSSVAPAASEETNRAKHEIELTFWNSIKSSDNPDLFKAYIEAYPAGAFAIIARVRIAELERQSGETQKQETGERQAIAPSSETNTQQTQELASLDQSEPKTPEPGNETENTVSRETILGIQKELNRVGCHVGNADGIWGRKSRNALKLYQRHSGGTVGSLEPTNILLPDLQSQDGRVCPLVCRSGFEIKAGRCVKKQKAVANVNPQPTTQSQTKPAAKSTQRRPDATAYAETLGIAGSYRPKTTRKTEYGTIVCEYNGATKMECKWR